MSYWLIRHPWVVYVGAPTVVALWLAWLWAHPSDPDLHQHRTETKE